MAFAVDRLVDTNDKEGIEWVGACIANVILYRPNATCKIFMMERDLKAEKRALKRQVAVLDKDIFDIGNEFDKLVRANLSPDHLRETTRILHAAQRERKYYLGIISDIYKSKMELGRLKNDKTEQARMIGMMDVSRYLGARAHHKNLNRKMTQYEVDREYLESVRESFHESWNSSDDGMEEKNINDLIRQKIIERGIPMPKVPVFESPPKPPMRSTKKILQSPIGEEGFVAPPLHSINRQPNSSSMKDMVKLYSSGTNEDLELFMRYARLQPDD
jgi:hypothetical protein